MQDNQEFKMAQSSKTVSPYKIIKVESNQIGSQGCLHLIKASWPNLEEINLCI
jgi:hypothetical protein